MSKYILIIMLFLSTDCFAREYHWVWTIKRDLLEYKVDGDDWSDAYNKAFAFCAKFVKDQYGVNPNTYDGVDELVDYCSNPREKH